ncbi:MAG TPA: DUF1656 domain-containing protein [Novosphingobium sp.]|nr:DUF1656 domain-containing protein [Novosphingobium sp.]
MIAEFNLNGVYFASIPITSLLALVATLVLHRLLALVGAYRWIWHAALFDAALFICLWALLVTTSLDHILGKIA